MTIEIAPQVHQNGALSVFKGVASGGCESHFSYVSGHGYHVTTNVNIPDFGKMTYHDDVYRTYGERQTTLNEYKL